MTKKRRNAISVNIPLLESVKDKLDMILFEEQDTYDNIPENLQGSMRGMESEEAIDNLNDAIDNIDRAIEALEEII